MAWTVRTSLGALAGAASALVLVAGLVLRPGPSREAPPPGPSAPERTVPEAAPPQLHGHIRDANGEAVADAHVRVMAHAHVVAETVTDPAGSFSFSSVATQRVRVEADHDPQGAVRSAELSLVEATTELTLVLAPAGVRGLVVDAEDGHPVANAALSVEGVAWPVPATTSDATGAFRLPVVPFEAVSLVALGQGYGVARVKLGVREDQPEPALRIELHRGLPADGDVLDPDGKPLRATVVACEGQANEARLESAEDGTFRLPASAVGCDAVALHDEMAPSDAVPVTAGRRTTLRLGAGGSIAGSVVDNRGARVDSFSVGVESFVASRGPSTSRSGARPFGAGAFRMERLVPGTYVLTASTQGRPPARSGPIDVRPASVTDGVRIVLAPGGVVTGHVVDDRRAPLGGVVLRFDLVSAVADSNATATTDASGGYRLEGAPAGPFTLRIQKDGFRSKLVSGLWAASGQSITKDVTLTAVDGGGGMELGGIGAGLAPAPGGGVAFAMVFPGDPAERAGLRAGDRIVRIDGEGTAGLSVVDAIQRLRGEAGTVVGVSVDRAGAQLDFAITRAAMVH